MLAYKQTKQVPITKLYCSDPEKKQLFAVAGSVAVDGIPWVAKVGILSTLVVVTFKKKDNMLFTDRLS